MESHTERVSTHGQTVRCTRASGQQDSSKAKVSGRESSVTAISVNGTSLKQPDMVYINGKMVTALKESGLIA